MNVKSLFLALALSIGATLGIEAQITATEAFTSAPRKVMPMLDQTTRLDMVDYFNNGMSTSSTNLLNGRSRITALSDNQLTVELSDASTCDMIVLQGEGNQFIAVITTVATPAPDSRMSVYSSDWKRDITASVFTKPTLTDWLTPEGKKNRAEVESLVPFLLISYTYNPETATLTLTNNVKEFLGNELYDTIATYIRPSLTYQFNGKRFNLVK